MDRKEALEIVMEAAGDMSDVAEERGESGISRNGKKYAKRIREAVTALTGQHVYISKFAIGQKVWYVCEAMPPYTHTPSVRPVEWCACLDDQVYYATEAEAEAECSRLNGLVTPTNEKGEE